MTATPETGPGVKRYRKKPVEVDAMHWDGAVSTATTIIDWILANGGTARYHHESHPRALSIDTLEGTMNAVPGDWIIKGVVGEFYSCREEIFATTHEPADGADPVAAERERIANLAEELDAMYSPRAGADSGIAFSFADFIRGQR